MTIVPESPITNKSTVTKLTAWHKSDHKSSFEAIMSDIAYA